jgi:ABC-2 type transport system ATP-binding protein
MIIVNHIFKRYNNRMVVSDVHLKIKEGEIVGLLGPNGAGKTTTLRIIAGVLPPTEGSVRFDDVDLESDVNLKRFIGFLPENNPLYDEMTVEEYLSFWADIKQVPKDKKREAVNFVVDRCGIADVYYRPISELSKGYRQRVGFSQAILTKPKVLILDEPTEGLDPNQRQDIANLIKQLGKERTVIISSHVLGELSKIASRMVIIHKGAIVADDTPENLKKFGSSTQVIEMEVRGRNVLSTLKRISGVTEVSQRGKNYFVIKVDRKDDIREELYSLSVRNKWVLLTLLAKERAIEDVFSQLTNS